MANRIAVVTGGMGGLGQAICRELHKQGFQVIAGYSRAHEAARNWQDEQKNGALILKLAMQMFLTLRLAELRFNKLKQRLAQSMF